jgi:Polyketide cyclase / dehydrase and lipid transport
VRRPWFKARPAGEDFLDAAPLILREAFEIPLAAERVWGELTNDEPLAWCRILQAVDWTSPRPFGVGTTRTVHALGGLAVLRERYFRWEEGRRHSFTLEEATAPLFRSLVEDYSVEPTSDASSRFTWTIAIDPHPAARIATPVNKVLLGTLFTDTRKHYGLD